jgi:Tfp pilus assembly protein PilF
MKALEKAAKDRDEARAEPVATTPAGEREASQPATYTPSMPGTAAPAAPAAQPGPRSELSLEPMPVTPEPSIAAAAPRAEPPTRPAGTARAGRSEASSREQQAKAATVMQATGAAAGDGAVARILSRPVWLVAIAATLIGIGYGTYVYLQLFHPALFLPKPPIAPKGPLSPIGQAPTPGSVPATSPAAGADPGASSAPAIGTAPGVAAGSVIAAAPDAAAKPGMPTTSAPAGGAGVPDFAPPPPAPAAPRVAEKPVPEAPPPPPAPPAARDTIKVSRSNAAASVSPMLNNAYAALQSDRRDDAQRAYEQLLRNEPRNVDALLGLASIATTEGRSEEAMRRYMQILELEPQNTLAQSGLIALVGRADPIAAESRLKQLIAREPSAYLHFTLGNLFADQGKWAAAQHAYFQAHHLEPGNPDYAYNLAVGLEHVSQGKLALGYYRRAVDLAATTGRARFDVAQAQQRISKLASQVE